MHYTMDEIMRKMDKFKRVSGRNTQTNSIPPTRAVDFCQNNEVPFYETNHCEATNLNTCRVSLAKFSHV